MYAGDRDRERAARQLRDHYVAGRLTVEELTERTARVTAARTRAELREALVALPGLDLLVLLCTAAYLVFTLALLVALLVTLLLGTASASTLVAFLLVWLVPTYLLTRLWHGPRARLEPARKAPPPGPFSLER